MLDKMASALAQVLATFEVFIEPATVKLEECETPDGAPDGQGGSGGVETAVTIQVASLTLANATKNAVDTYSCADPSCFWPQLQDNLNSDKIAQGTCVDPDEPVKIVRVQFLPPTAPPPDAPLTQMLIVNAGQNVETGNKQLKDEEIVGIVLGSIFGVFLLCALAGLVVLKRKAPKLTQVEKEQIKSAKKASEMKKMAQEQMGRADEERSKRASKLERQASKLTEKSNKKAKKMLASEHGGVDVVNFFSVSSSSSV